MANGYMKMCSTSLITREMQIKTIMRHHLTPARMTINQKTKDDKCWQGCGEKRTHLYCCWTCKLVQTSMENILEVPQKIKSRAMV